MQSYEQPLYSQLDLFSIHNLTMASSQETQKSPHMRRLNLDEKDLNELVDELSPQLREEPSEHPGGQPLLLQILSKVEQILKKQAGG